jgi:hypothetical protein
MKKKRQLEENVTTDPEVIADFMPYLVRRPRFSGPQFEVDVISRRIIASPADPFGFGAVMQCIVRREYVSGDELARLLDAATGRPLPPLLNRYLVAFLAGQITKTRGRKPPDEADQRILELAYMDQQRIHARLKKWMAAHNGELFPGWEAAEWYPSSPKELSILFVQRTYFPDLDPDTVRNKLSAFAPRRRKAHDKSD